MKKLILPLLLPLISFGQGKPGIGDMVPPIAIKNISNYKSSSLRLSDVKGKLLILDFFASWCTPCINSLPRLDSLQQLFGNSLQVFIVTAESQDKIEGFRKKNKTFATMSLPVITADTTLKKLFPHMLIPHEVWIDANGIVRAITGAEQVTAANISDFIGGRPINMRMKKDIMDFDHHKPILDAANGIDDKILLTRSSIMTGIDGLSSMEGMLWSADSLTRRLFYINSPLWFLYSTAGRPMSDESKGRSLYSYELTVPASMTKDEAKAWMVQDLDRYFKKQK